MLMRPHTPPSALARFLGVLGSSALLALPAAQAGMNAWTSTGPDGGYAQGVEWHPARSGVVFAAAGRVYRSLDGGMNWSATSGPSSVSGRFVFDPLNPDRILASGAPAMRSEDGGASFTSAAELPGRVDARFLAVAPGGAAIYASGGGKVYRTTDFARTWVDVSVGLPGGQFDTPTGLLVSPTDPGTLYASFNSGGLFKSTNAAASWSRITALPTNVSRIAINPNNSSHLLASSPSSVALHRSIDGGATWSTVLFGFIAWIEFDPLVTNRVIVMENASRRLHVSTDAGGVWMEGALVPTPASTSGAFSPYAAGTLATSTAEGIYISNDVGQTLSFRSTGINGADLLAIAASRVPPYRVYATFFGGPGGVHMRTPGGWQAANNEELFATMGFPMVLNGLAVDSNDSSTVFVAGSEGIARSADAGSSWLSLSPVLAAADPLRIAIDTSDARNLYAASATDGVLYSPDGGGTWVQRNSGLPVVGSNVPIGDLVVDPADSQRMYAFQQSTGAVFRSADGGLNWARMGGGLPTNEVARTMAFDPLDADRIYLGANLGLYQSRDGGITWSVIPLPTGMNQIGTILVDPVVTGKIVLFAGSAAAMLRTVDHGASWERLPWDLGVFSPPRGGVLDPVQPGNLIVSAFQRGMWEFQVAPDLSVALTGADTPVAPGSTRTVRATVRNKADSPFASSDATVTVTLPSSLTPVSIATTLGSCARFGQRFDCRMGAMKVGDFALVDVTATQGTGSGNVMASVQGHEPDPAMADNSVTAPTVLRPVADLSVTVSGLPAAMTAGQTASASVTVTNNGPDAVNIAVATVSGSNLGFGTLTAGAGSCAIAAATANCSLGAIASGTSRTIAVTFTPVAQGSVQLTATTGSEALDAPMGNNDATGSGTAAAAPAASGGTPSSGASAGGGGAVDVWELLAALFWLSWRFSRCHPPRHLSGFGLSAVKRLGLPSL